MVENFLSYLMQNSLTAYLISLGIFVGLFVVFKVLDSYAVFALKKFAKRTKNNIDDLFVGFLEKIGWPFYLFISFYIASLFLKLPDAVNVVFKYLLVIFIVFYASRGLIGVSNSLFDIYQEKRKSSNKSANESMTRVMKLLLKVAIWSLALLMALSNFGVEITPLIASLGVGGVAIAIALQRILGDLFSAFAIYLDKPFEEGDFIIIGDDMGVVKHIGIRSTRIEALGGQELVIGNSELTSSRINNYKKMNRRRVVFSFGVEYKTTVKQLKEIKKAVEKIIIEVKDCTLDRVHFKQFGDSSLNFECVYYLESSDYNVYMDRQEEINLRIKEKTESLGVSFAFPTRTIYLEK